jgi:hypothetical protein
VDYKFCAQIAGARDNRIAGRTTARKFFSQLFQNGWPTRVVDGAIDATTA